jgi:hypothetical protein
LIGVATALAQAPEITQLKKQLQQLEQSTQQSMQD